MRALAACALPALLVACPVAWSGIATALGADSDTNRLPIADLARGWRGTLQWCIPIALASAALGWLPGRVLRERIAAGRGAIVLVGTLWSLLMPPYALFYCGWRLCRPGMWIGDWAATHDHVATVRHVALALSLVSWTWPVSALCVAALGPHRRAEAEDAALLDARSWGDRWRAACRSDWLPLLAAFAAVLLALVGETTSFDVARVMTAASELRLLDAAGSGPATLWVVASVPSAIALMGVLGALAAWRTLSARRDTVAGVPRAGLPARCSCAVHRAGVALVAALVGVAALVPGVLLARDGLRSGAWTSFAALHGEAAFGSLMSALLGGALGALVAATTCIAAMHGRGAWAVASAGAMWAVGTALPGVLLATAYESMWNSVQPLRTVYDSAAMVPMAQVAHAGLACWMVGCLMASRVPREAVDVARLHAHGVRDMMRAHAPSICTAAAGGGAVMAAYCASETAIASRLLPPGAERIAPILMNAIHYQDQSAALAALPWIGALGALMAALAVCAWARHTRVDRVPPSVGRAAAMWAAVALCLLGCGSGGEQGAGGSEPGPAAGSVRADPRDRGGAGFAAMASDVEVSEDAPPPLSCEQVIGMRGRMPGRFDYPRAADVAPDGTVAVIDKSGRVQRFAADGSLINGWRMPRTDNGMPTGITVDRHGRLWIADTHEHRVLVCSPDGTELGSFGGYGREPGQFIYPTDILMLDDADASRCAAVVSEYGGNDRLQWFEVSCGTDGVVGSPVRAVGGQGSGTGQFLRPQSMSRMPDGSIAVADACNHRIVRLSPEGRWLGAIGQPGRDLGQLSYPYGVRALRDGAVLVAEFGNNRIQCLDASGRGLWVRGGGGRDIGRLVAPWAIVGDESEPLVVDAGNCRLVRVSLPAIDER